MKEQGSAAVEFALVLPLLVALLMGAAEVGLVARLQLELLNAAREGAREAATVADPDRAVDAVRGALDSGAAGRVRVTVRRQDRVGGQAEVRVAIRHQVASALFGGAPIELRARAVMRVER